MVEAVPTPLRVRQLDRARDKLIVALDVAAVSHALELVERLGEAVSFYKIGLHLQFDRELHALFDHLLLKQKRIFVDFKAFDIPATVEGAVRMAASLGIDFVTVVGQRPIVQAALRARGNATLKILAVTLLTGMNQEDMQREYNTALTTKEFIRRRAKSAAETGCDGVISSAREAALIRDSVDRSDFLIVTPGIRLPGAMQDDQKRVMTPYDAISCGADYIVVGRPIVKSADPAAAAAQILADMDRAS
ncbi:MAG TPA: orotidine-5'-phosphate decarboxylase [Stellaceae bacterium]|jgi:orotidine-5'-phosphate decarboxylase|nr:orotidine-5'-phosphate decarboxylase [Stellaceae bacterium]